MILYIIISITYSEVIQRVTYLKSDDIKNALYDISNLIHYLI